MSFLRSPIVRWPSSSSWPPSPVRNQPSCSASAVASGCAPVAAQHAVAAGEHLAVGRGAQPHAERGRAGAQQAAVALGVGQAAVGRAGAVEHEQRRGLGQAVDLHELPAELVLEAGDRAARRRRAAAQHAHAAAAGRVRAPLAGGVEHHVDDGRRAAHQRHAVAGDAAQDLAAVDLAQDHLGHAEAGAGEREPPAVGVEHRHRVQVDVAVGDAQVQGHRRRVQPQVAVRQLDALRPRGRPARVVDRGQGVLVAAPTRAARSPLAQQRARRDSAPRTSRRSQSIPRSGASSSGSTSSIRGAAVVDDVARPPAARAGS